MDDIIYLQSLDDKLWKKTRGKHKPYMVFHTEKRIILLGEFDKICEILGKDNGIVFCIHNDCMGFGVGMSVYDSSNMMDRILHINQKHFSPNNYFDDAWPIFKQLAEQFSHKLTEPLREKSYYEY